MLSHNLLIIKQKRIKYEVLEARFAKMGVVSRVDTSVSVTAVLPLKWNFTTATGHPIKIFSDINGLSAGFYIKNCIFEYTSKFQSINITKKIFPAIGPIGVTNSNTNSPKVDVLKLSMHMILLLVLLQLLPSSAPFQPRLLHPVQLQGHSNETITGLLPVTGSTF